MTTMQMVACRSSRWQIYHVWELPVPRIQDGYLNCVVYLYPSEVDAEDGTRAGGSGFLVGVPTAGLRKDFIFLYVVSNKHVIKSATVIRMNTAQGAKTIMPTARASWVSHPDGDDIAACVISFDPREYRFTHIPISTFITKEIIDKYEIGPGDEAFMVGRFVNHEGRQGNLPTARFGNIAQMPWEPVIQDTGFEQESFLVEMRSVGGYSGSPVFAHILAGNRPAKMWRDEPMNSLMGFGPWLLGVDWGHLNEWSPVRRDNGEPVNPGNPTAMQVRLNTGMAAVVPAWKLAELLMAGTLADHRQTVIASVLEYEKNNPPVSTMEEG